MCLQCFIWGYLGSISSSQVLDEKELSWLIRLSKLTSACGDCVEECPMGAIPEVVEE